ncbi:MAG: ribbon-helix-helix protein, CopG family [Bryobacteraceae bacterium]|nr:ribbon-helix-helix protein, CopG family [Bryobacteraceae bacterium]
MASGKTSTLTFRIEPALKDALRAAAEKEHRSIANMVEVLIRDYCGRNGITIQQRTLRPDDQRKPRSRNR